MSNSFHNKLCVITGGSSGIGYSIAQALADQGARLLLIARDPAKLDAAAAELRQRGARQVEVLSADINRAADLARIVPAISQLAGHQGAADLLVNSAGIVSAGLLEDVPREEWQRLFQLNLFALVEVLQAVLPAMRLRAEQHGQAGHIVNIASAAGIVGFPGMAAYGATKAAVMALGESLRAELSALNIGVTTVCPGFVQTPIAEKVQLFGRMNNPKVQRSVQQWFSHNRLLPQTVAAATLKAVRRNQALVVVGRDAHSGYWAKRIAPALLRRITAKAAAPQSRSSVQTA